MSDQPMSWTGKFGEMSLRQLDGKWVFTFAQFERGGSIDGIVLDHPTSDLRTAHRRTLIRNAASESTEDGTHLSHLYGGYIIAGSTLDELHLAVSQWDDHRYQVVQFRVEGITRPG
jgi:D-arabinan endo alpha-(1,5)-arabinofuranosidase